MSHRQMGMFVLCFAIAVPVAADDKANAATDRSGAMNNVCKASDALGATVKNRQNESLGELEDFAMTKEGEIRYAIIGHGGVVGIGETYTAVPWDRIMVDYTKKSIVLDMTLEKLKSAPKLKQEGYRELYDASWRAQLDSSFVDAADSKPRQEDKPEGSAAAASAQFFFASNLIGANVQGPNPDDGAVADINDLVVAKSHKKTHADQAADLRGKDDQPDAADRPQQGRGDKGLAKHGLKQAPERIEFAIIGVGGALEIGETDIAVPFKALTLRTEGEDRELLVSLSMTEKQLQNAPKLKQENYADLSNEQFVTRTNEFFNVTVRTEIETERPAKEGDKNKRPQPQQPNQEQPNQQDRDQ